MRIRDGYATVTGYKLPVPLVCQTGKVGARFEASSQNIGLVVLVVIPQCGINFSVKRRMRPARSVDAERESLNALPSFSVLSGSEGFLFSDSALVSQP